MIFFHKKYHPVAAVVGIVLICVIQIAIPLHQARAIPVAVVEDIPTWLGVLGTWVESIITVIKQAADYILQNWMKIEIYARIYILKPAMRILIFTAVKSITDQTVSWITGDGGRNTGFVKNLEQNLRDEADLRAGEFLNHITGINFCSVNIRNLLTVQLGLGVGGADYNRLNSQLSCKLSSAVANVERFYNDFREGSWKTFVNVSLTPENNAYGAYVVAKANYQSAIGSKTNQLQQNMQANRGFLGVQITKKSEKCDWQPDRTDDDGVFIPGHQFCHTEDVATTPGGLVADALGGSMVNNGPNALMSSDEVAGIIDAALTQIVTAAVQKLTSGDLFKS